MQLCGHQLPWVSKLVHLGNTFTDKVDIVTDDMNIKRARYIGKNIELNQEFYFASESTRIRVKEIYNSSWFGSTLWDLSCPGAIRQYLQYKHQNDDEPPLINSQRTDRTPITTTPCEKDVYEKISPND